MSYDDPFPWIDRSQPFSFALLHSHPWDILDVAPERTPEPKRVCVVGGGIAGLTAAYELHELGYQVTLLEASDRFGGRILTYRFDAHNYGELGAMRIPVEHLCTLHYIKEFSLDVDWFVEENSKGFFYLRGKRIPIGTLGSWEPLRQKDPNLYPNIRSHIGDVRPLEVRDAKLKLMKETIIWDPQEAWEVYTSTLGSPMLQLYDSLSLWQYINRPGLHGQRLTSTAYEVLNNEEWEYIGRATGLIRSEKVSCLDELTNLLPSPYPESPKLRIVGGMDLLVQGFVELLPKVLHLNSLVKRIAVVDDGRKNKREVEVIWLAKYDPKGIRRQRFDYVVCATPALATAHIEFRPPLPAEKYEALTGLSYQSAAKSLVYCNRRRWEYQDRIFGGVTYTDLPVQECWYPSDNAQESDDKAAHTDDRGYEYTLPSMGETLDPLDIGSVIKPRVPSEWEAKERSVSRGPGVLTGAYISGTSAERFNSMSPEQRDELVISCLERIHRGIARDVRGVKHWSWDEHTNPGGGAWASFGPGEHDRYQAALVKPVPEDRPKIFFAGEHLGITHGWIQSAIQTALGAVCYVHEGP